MTNVGEATALISADHQETGNYTDIDNPFNGDSDSERSRLSSVRRHSTRSQISHASATSGDSKNLQIYELTEDGRFDSLSSATLAWRDLHVTSAPGSRRTFSSICKCNDGSEAASYKYTEILKRVSGVVEPGQFLAILGASGSGKTTLLNTLAQRKTKHQNIHITGTIQVNGWPIEESQMSLISAYVEQEDNFISVLTVRETMLFHAILRMDKRITDHRRLAKVNAIIKKLGLTKCQHNIVGNPAMGMKGISGGERKRLSVAVELLMDPPLLFMDEPTSGLDAYMAETMVKLIGKLAQANRTILMTIHQPSSEVFALFDKVCLLSDGHIAFLGDSTDAVKHFDTFGKPCPPMFNPADHFIFELAVKVGQEEECLARIEALTNYYKDSDYYKKVDDKISEVVKVNTVRPNIISRKNLQVNIFTQLKENVKRGFLIARRTPRLTRRRWIETVFWAILTGFAFFMIKNDQEVGQNKSGLLFFICTSLTFPWTSSLASALPPNYHVVRKEYKVGMYGVGSYLLGVVVYLVPNILMLTMVQLILSYFFTGLQRTIGPFLVTYVVSCSVCWVAACLGIFLGVAADSVGSAMAFMAPIVLPFLLFGGLYQNDNATPYWFYPVKYLSWIRYGWASLMVNEFKDMEIECDRRWNHTASFGCPFENGNQILELYGIDDAIFWPNVVVNLLLGVVLCFMSLVRLWWKVRK